LNYMQSSLILRGEQEKRARLKIPLKISFNSFHQPHHAKI